MNELAKGPEDGVRRPRCQAWQQGVILIALSSWLYGTRALFQRQNYYNQSIEQ